MHHAGIPVEIYEKGSEEKYHYPYRWERILAWFARLVNPDFDLHYTQTLYTRIYKAGTWDSGNAGDFWTLYHECTHIVQWWRLKRFLRWGPLAYLVWGMLYALVLPIVFTMRGRYERQAYADECAVMLRAGCVSMASRRAQSVNPEFRRIDTYAWMAPWMDFGKVYDELVENRAERQTLLERTLGFRIPSPGPWLARRPNGRSSE
jgi:hypothetical protein